VQKGEFRADLYYRISVVPIFLPPLRERKGDLAPLANEFLRRFNVEQGVHLSFSPSAMEVLAECGFPGNIRELENCVYRTATLARGEAIVDKDFSCRNDGCLSAVLWSGSHEDASHAPQFRQQLPIVSAPKPQPISPPRVAEETEAPQNCPGAENCTVAGVDQRTDREKLVAAMEQAGWVKAKAARLLGLTPRQIGYALQKHDIAVRKF